MYILLTRGDIIWKTVCTFFMSISLLASNTFVNVERNRLNYEVLNMTINKNNIIVEGWATMPNTQHFTGSKTHSYELEIKSKSHNFTVSGSIVNRNLTDQMAYTGHDKCKSNQLNTTSCNFDHKYVGFEFSIPLNKLKEGNDYKLYLKMHAKQSGKRYRIPLFYTSKNNLFLESDRTEYIIESDFSHASFSIFGHTLIARSGPSPKSNMIWSGKSCSTSYGNSWFLKQNAVFKNILDIKKYNNLITYFKVEAYPNGCVNNRLRVIESKHKNRKTVYVPSTHVNYIGNPTTIKVRRKISIPVLNIQDAELNQYDEYKPLDYTRASDKFDGNISKDVIVTSTNVNMKIPGKYTTCYKVTNSSKKTATGCGLVNVKKIPSKRRFVSRFTIHDTELRRWNRQELDNKLKDKKNLKSETISP